MYIQYINRCARHCFRLSVEVLKTVQISIHGKNSQTRVSFDLLNVSLIPFYGCFMFVEQVGRKRSRTCFNDQCTCLYATICDSINLTDKVIHLQETS